MPKSLTKALDIRFVSDIGEVSIRNYLCQLLQKVWEEEEDFSGKRAFGNGGWQEPVYVALIGAGFLDGEIDDDDCLLSVENGKEFMLRLIDEMCYGESDGIEVL